jgi:hypothetical protein
VAGRKVTPIWPGVAPGSEGRRLEEVESRGLDGKRIVRNVTTPTLTAFLPDPATATGAAVIVCPGGGFRFLSESVNDSRVVGLGNALPRDRDAA